YALSQRALYRDGRARFVYFAALLLLGIGMAWNNSLAVAEAFTRRGNTFRRTPKFRVEQDADAWESKEYALAFSWEAVGELGLGVYALAGVVIAWQQKFFWALPYLLLYAAGFFYTGLLSIAHSLPAFKSQVAGRRSQASSPL
ncbi:MAG: hypothetical protein HY327_02450, partial [Chloroflexi bacterium]|nr:hypothetical protein [Chloroflexota bacterium]